MFAVCRSYRRRLPLATRDNLCTARPVAPDSNWKRHHAPLTRRCPYPQKKGGRLIDWLWRLEGVRRLAVGWRAKRFRDQLHVARLKALGTLSPARSHSIGPHLPFAADAGSGTCRTILALFQCSRSPLGPPVGSSPCRRSGLRFRRRVVCCLLMSFCYISSNAVDSRIVAMPDLPGPYIHI